MKDGSVPLALWPLVLQHVDKNIDEKAPTISKSILYNFSIREKNNEVIMRKKWRN
jgi:hypothetical protein